MRSKGAPCLWLVSGCWCWKECCMWSVKAVSCGRVTFRVLLRLGDSLHISERKTMLYFKANCSYKISLQWFCKFREPCKPVTTFLSWLIEGETWSLCLSSKRPRQIPAAIPLSCRPACPTFSYTQSKNSPHTVPIISAFLHSASPACQASPGSPHGVYA